MELVRLKELKHAVQGDDELLFQMEETQFRYSYYIHIEVPILLIAKKPK